LLVHYVKAIHDFGSPNSLCSSITKNKHIDAVKRPWWWSNRNKAIFQILKTNKRKQKLVAARAKFGRKGMLNKGLMEHAQDIAAARDAGDNMDVAVSGRMLQLDGPVCEWPCRDNAEDNTVHPNNEPAHEPAQAGTLVTLGRCYGVFQGVSMWLYSLFHSIPLHYGWSSQRC
jgi:hypothetical protein